MTDASGSRTDVLPTWRNHIGCIALAGILMTGAVLVAVSAWRLNAFVTEYEARFRDQGWAQLDGSTITEETAITTPTLIFASDITLSGATADIALLGGDAVLMDRYSGDVSFLGRNLDIHPDAHIEGRLIIAGARYVSVRGTVEGGVEGSWDRLFGPTEQQDPAARADTAE
ncbi:MAG: hypothetical protein QF561_00925 [Phycisphaerales bacterium]|jgi:hypothetical protein|nr:hypothetical protein [Phycisphaerales bacterium]